MHYLRMRTTIEIPESLRKKLILDAAETNRKGFSEIVVFVLDEYFKKKEDKGKKLRGKDLRKTNLAGIWKNRKEINDSTEFVR
ncbi:MAG: hypothetical protein EBS19_11095, partial [Spirochaetia bacterium]|nr:hypothetical protein [Spirochaetia bacterium]